MLGVSAEVGELTFDEGRVGRAGGTSFEVLSVSSLVVSCVGSPAREARTHLEQPLRGRKVSILCGHLSPADTLEISRERTDLALSPLCRAITVCAVLVLVLVVLLLELLVRVRTRLELGLLDLAFPVRDVE